MRYGVAADHAGFPFKQHIINQLQALGHDVGDYGGEGDPDDDYPDFARALGEAVASGEIQRGVLVCGSGVGASVAASKIPGVRAAICHDNYSAHQGVEHDDMNVLTLGSRVIGPELALELVRTFERARFTRGERHVRRLAKVHDIEQHYQKSPEVSHG